MICPQCSRSISVWRRGLLSGLCPRCQVNPCEQAQAAQARRRRLATRAAWGAVGAASAAGLAAVLYCTPVLRGPVEDARFSADAWAAGDHRTRGRMARDLVASRVLVGKPRDEVRRVLGPPDIEVMGLASYRYRVDVDDRWVFRPVPCDLFIRFMKVEHWAYTVEIRPVEVADPRAAADRGTSRDS